MRIISLVPSITETLYALGLEDQIVAVTRFCIYPADRVKLKPKVGGTKNPKLEQILRFQPDIVIMNVDENRKEDGEFLKQKGVQLFITFPNCISETCELLRKLGQMLSVEEKADRMSATIEALASEFQPPAKKKTLIMIWRNPYMTVAPGTYVDSIACHFGFENVIQSAEERYPQLNDKEILSLDPHLTLFPDDPFPFRDRHVDEFRKRFSQLRCVRENHLAWFDGSYLTWFGYRTLLAFREFPAIARRLRLWE